jgi:MinD superfamily P-loop ATPase
MEIAIISGKGGTGKSSLSAAFATLNKNIIVADCDVDAANLHLLFNPSMDEDEAFISGHKAIIDYSKCTNCKLCMEYCRFDAISFINEQVTISVISCEGCFLCSRVCPENAIDMIPNDENHMYSGSFRNGKMIFGRLAPGEENSGKLVNIVREKAKKIQKENRIEHIILDGPPGIGCPVISTITGVDKVIIVTEPTISGLNDLQRATELVQKSGRMPLVVINKSDLNPSMTRKIDLWCDKNQIRVIEKIPFDKKVVEAMVRGKSITEYDPDSITSKKIGDVWNKILDNPRV